MSWRVVNRINECDDGKRIPKNITVISCLVIHRIGPSLGANAVEIARAFKDDSTPWSAGSYTGCQVPYSFILGPDGTIEQSLSLDDTGWHARRWSKPGVGIACIGDFRVDYPTPEMWESLTTLCSVLGFWIGTYSLYGHTELPYSSSSKDPNKQCPGKKLDMDHLRNAVKERLQDTAPDLMKLGKELILEDYGIAIHL